MHIVGAIVFVGLIFAIIFGPSWWASFTLARFSTHRDDFPGTGGEMARHLLDKKGLKIINIEVTKEGDHYDPVDKVVRLQKENFDGKSVTAVAVAAHEVGHALQDAEGNSILRARVVLAKIDTAFQSWGKYIFYGLLGFSTFSRSPVFAKLAILVAGLGWFASIFIQIFSLPTEWDASFRKALPMLAEGDYLHPTDMVAAQTVLKACAFTYLASAILSLASSARWWRR
ncbi:MAG: zinc metallopeptidase [Magnetococcales bacterium]|nr:zinc metallopeptidase [Magnetococcales bacterium]